MLAAFRHSLVAGREALHISAVSEAINHFELAHQLVREESLPEMSADADIRNLYNQLGRSYQLSGQTDMALVMAADQDRLG